MEIMRSSHDPKKSQRGTAVGRSGRTQGTEVRTVAEARIHSTPQWAGHVEREATPLQSPEKEQVR